MQRGQSDGDRRGSIREKTGAQVDGVGWEPLTRMPLQVQASQFMTKWDSEWRGQGWGGAEVEFGLNARPWLGASSCPAASRESCEMEFESLGSAL